MDMYYFTKPGGLSIHVMIDGDRDDDGNLTACHEMTVIFRKSFAMGLCLKGGGICHRCIRERYYRIAPERWEAVNRKYCRGELDIL